MTGNADLNSTETLLRDALDAHTRDLSPAAGFVTATVDRSVEALRRTRARQLVSGAGALAALVGLALWQAPSLDDNGSTPPTTHSDAPPIIDAYAWAQSLPRGADADVAYVDGSTLVVGDEHVDLGSRAEGLQILSPLPGGWLARVEAPDTTDGMYYGYLGADGQFTEYEWKPAKGLDSGFAASPDGTEVAYARAVVRTGLTDSGLDPAVAGTKAVDLPADAVTVVDWTGAGLVYRDAQQRIWLWSPGSNSIRQHVDAWVPSGYGYERRGDCVFVSPPTVPGFVTAPYQLCGAGDPLTVSTSRRALMSSGEFVNLEAGVDFMTLPVGVLPEQLQLFWETDDNLIIVVHDNLAEAHAPVLVRCLVTAGRCERASDPLQVYPQLAALPLPGA